jgi:hypothetical protein
MVRKEKDVNADGQAIEHAAGCGDQDAGVASTATRRQPTIDCLATLERRLIARFGEVLGNDSLAQALNYPSTLALRRACERGKIHVPVFRMPDRPGRFALTADVADFLWSMRQGACDEAAPSITEDDTMVNSARERSSPTSTQEDLMT